MQGGLAIVTELLRNDNLKRNFAALKEAIECAVRFSELTTFEVLLQEPIVANNQLLMIDLLKLSVDKQNSQMMSVILKHAKVTFPLVRILDAIHLAMNKPDDQTVLLLLKSSLKIAPYARRDIFYNAAQKGRRVIIEHFMNDAAKTLTEQNVSHAIRLAASNNHTDLLLDLIRYCGSNLTTSDKKFIRATACYQSSSVLKLHTALAEPIKISDIPEITEITQQFKSVKLEDEIVEQPSQHCLMQYTLAREALNSIDSSRKTNSLDKKNIARFFGSH